MMVKVHELQVTQSVLDTVLETARSSGLVRVSVVRLVIGELNDLRQQWIQRYFDYLSEGTAAEGARILVRTVPAAFGCRDCGREFQVQISASDALCCPSCQGRNLFLSGGRDFLIQDMEGE